MGDLSLADISKAMQDIDFAMLMTHTEGGEIAGRPMSNNTQVEYDGDSFYFSYEDTRTVDDIKRDARVALAFQGTKGLLGKPGMMISVEGRAELIHDKAVMQQHWTKDIDRWFEKGVDTPGIVLIKVHANRVHYWDGEDEGEVRV